MTQLYSVLGSQAIIETNLIFSKKTTLYICNLFQMFEKFFFKKIMSLIKYILSGNDLLHLSYF